ncbi:MAG TPA: bifunctional tetrahydrofolate synthase/dihydrofolate synthase [Rhodanobacteraceae bacterium]|nr:bifunctional tetrahydrofolate synthase/dihydrofolate synthase [Rhodanobacteraceae bacterium]
MNPQTLAQWLEYQQHQHPAGIALGLDRVAAVWQRLGARRPAPTVITVGGTNGKGTTVAMLESMLRAAGQRTGAYTSPHLVRYTERLRIDGQECPDADWIAVFARVEAARAELPLTYFEFGTLAALELMADAGIDVALLEVGLGGRLDAVNLVAADAAIVVSVDLDHMEYLGRDRDQIGREKAGIFRAGRAAILGDREPPAGLLDAARERAADVRRIGVDFDLVANAPVLRWRAGAVTLDVPTAALDAPGRRDNAAVALAALHALTARLGWPVADYQRGLAEFTVPARVQRFAGPPEVIVDVAHNPHAARALAGWLRAHPLAGRTLAVFSALADKDIPAIAAILGAHIARWHLCALTDAGARGLAADAVAARVRQGWPTADIVLHGPPAAALAAAQAEALPGDRVLAFGSFHLAGSVLPRLGPL